MKENFLKAYLTKWRKMSSRGPRCDGCEFSYKWANWPNSMHERSSIPRNVPKGHLAVYVGKDYKRFVIKTTLLKHPLFKALLDRARDEYGFATDSRLCIPCDESPFLNVVRCVNSPQDCRFSRCL
ncbi:DNA topoisomerase 6 subunit A-like [Hibiscus syriacus]|uniref:DNA topoisomerase 6 subunit A-like n=1 Tax=Hibiscus syriacus TaxID=106335 RepID=A0A6A2YZ02_HIBSY|nr:indole-3-acetic acid-induced protein ARG7-like [Hibiscus syriacus]KAE8684824.1 DNA topoisomerase 6 subunit A-like [Hibiscus syriacus]